MVYFFAMETTRRRFASINSFLATFGFRFAAHNHCSVRFSSMSPTSLALSISRSSSGAMRSSLRASAAVSPLLSVGAPFEFPGFALERLQPLHGVADVSIRRLRSSRLKSNRAHHAATFQCACAPARISRARYVALLRLGNFFQLFRLLQSSVDKAPQFCRAASESARVFASIFSSVSSSSSN